MYQFTAEQTKNILIFLDRAQTKGFKESEAMMDIWTTIEDQKRAILEERGKEEQNATFNEQETPSDE